MNRVTSACLALLATCSFHVTVYGRGTLGPSCVIDTSDFPDTAPLILSPVSPAAIFYPEPSNPSSFEFGYGQKLQLLCAGNARGKLLLPAECAGGTKFLVKGKAQDFKGVRCQERHRSEIRPIGEKCGDSGSLYEIGFEVSDDDFLTNIDLCHDSRSSNTLWSHSTVVSAIAGRQHKKRVSDFSVAGGMYDGVDVKDAYKRASQYKVFLELFNGSQKMVHKYLPEKDRNLYLARGHLVANADGFYGGEQDGTFFYANVVPMWQMVNNGNWKAVEMLVRDLAAEKGSDFSVWTGGLGVLELPDQDNRPVEIYLIPDGRIPVPRILFKYVVDEANEKGIVFLTVNNPFLDKADVQSHRICKEYKACSKRLQHAKDLVLGFTYCCTVADFLEIDEVSGLTLPRFDSVKPLI